MTGGAEPPSESAIDIRLDEQYGQGTRVGFRTLGFSFAIPERWFGRTTPERTGFLIASPTESGAIHVMPLAVGGTSGLVAVLRRSWPVTRDFLLRPLEQAVEGPWVRAGFSGPGESDAVAGFAMGRAGVGAGDLVFVSVGPQQHREALQRVIAGLAESTLTAAPADDPLAAEWRDRLAGKTVAYEEGAISAFVSAGPLAASMPPQDPVKNVRYALRPGGSMRYRAPEGGASGDGEWRVFSLGEQAVLELRRADAHPEHRALDRMEGVVTMDGRRAVLDDTGS